MVTATTHPRDLQRHTGSSSVSEWARKNIGDNHRGKRKTYAMQPIRHNKRQKGKTVISDGTTEESNDSSSKTSSDDGNNGDDTGGDTASLATQETAHEQPLSPFTADQFTHCTQDQDHGGPASLRIASHTANAPVDSSDSSSHWIDDVLITSPYKYHITDIQSQQTTRWIYKWIETEFYNMCYQDRQGTTEWTPLHMAGTQDPPSSKPRYYAHVHGRVLCNIECTSNVVVDDDHHGLFSCIMEYLYLVCL
jgi:hypothetical protein